MERQREKAKELEGDRKKQAMKILHYSPLCFIFFYLAAWGISDMFQYALV